MESQETTNAISAQKIEHLEHQITVLEIKVESLASERNKALVYGIIVLGGLVVSLFAYIVHIFETPVK